MNVTKESMDRRAIELVARPMLPLLQQSQIMLMKLDPPGFVKRSATTQSQVSESQDLVPGEGRGRQKFPSGARL